MGSGRNGESIQILSESKKVHLVSPDVLGNSTMLGNLRSFYEQIMVRSLLNVFGVEMASSTQDKVKKVWSVRARTGIPRPSRVRLR